ncbi:MAG: 3,4-dehydroadipyl-CoA semialdehyde dehydrogenase [Polyangiales bacterium]
MSTLESYLCGRWVTGGGRPATLVNPSTEEPLAEASTDGLDFGAALDHARRVGGPALHAMTFAERGAMLKSLASALHAARDELLDLAMRNGGNTRGDAKFDVDGAAGTLGAYAELGASLGDARFLVDGEAVNIGRSSRLAGQHVLTPRRGAAVHVNAFNFPAWGLAEKAAVALLAGMPVITKPATATALVAHRMTQVFVGSGALPEGALQLVTGGAGDLLDRLGSQDVLAFTGGGSTGVMLRGKANLLAASTHVNVEADSLNAAVLGADVSRGTDTWDLFVADVVRDMTQKTGQKCTAIRRVLVPAEQLDAVQEDLCDRLSAVRVGNVLAEGVTMGPVSTATQLRDARAGIDRLVASGARVVLGGAAAVQGLGAPEGKGYYVAPTLLRVDDAARGDAVHEHEVFAPVATLIPYRSAAEAVAIVHRGGGSLVSTVYTDDRALAAELVVGVAASNGRVCVANAKVAGAWLGPGAVLPQLLHGGPGRAGGGEELGGLRGMGLYLQRTALQGYGPLLDHITAGAKRVG